MRTFSSFCCSMLMSCRTPEEAEWAGGYGVASGFCLLAWGIKLEE